MVPGVYSRCLLVAEARCVRHDCAAGRDFGRTKCRRRFDDAFEKVERMGCGSSPSGDALAVATQRGAERLRAMIRESFPIVSSGTCEDQGFTRILDIDECRDAGAVLSDDSAQGFRYDQPPAGYTSPGTDWPSGCTFHNADVRNPLPFFLYARGDCGVYNFHCVCRSR